MRKPFGKRLGELISVAQPVAGMLKKRVCHPSTSFKTPLALRPRPAASSKKPERSAFNRLPT